MNCGFGGTTVWESSPRVFTSPRGWNRITELGAEMEKAVTLNPYVYVQGGRRNGAIGARKRACKHAGNAGPVKRRCDPMAIIWRRSSHGRWLGLPQERPAEKASVSRPRQPTPDVRAGRVPGQCDLSSCTHSGHRNHRLRLVRVNALQATGVDCCRNIVISATRLNVRIGVGRRVDPALKQVIRSSAHCPPIYVVGDSRRRRWHPCQRNRVGWKNGNRRTCRSRAVDLTGRCNHVGFNGLGSSVQSGLRNRSCSLRNGPGYGSIA